MRIDEMREKFTRAFHDERETEVIGVKANFSVLILTTEKEGEPHFVFEVRSHKIDRQPGEICFPGGALEKGESRKEAAIRETAEELGINPKFVKNCGYLGTMLQYWGGAVHCFYGEIGEADFKAMKPSSAEVEEVFTAPVSWFFENKPDIAEIRMEPRIPEDFPYEKAGIDDTYFWGGGKTDIPVWNYQGHAVWGLTGRIILFAMKLMGGTGSKA